MCQLKEDTIFFYVFYGDDVIVRLSLLRKTILIPEYLAFMCVCVFVDGCIIVAQTRHQKSSPSELLWWLSVNK